MIDRNLIQKYNVAGPRYTSYPPATFFHEGFTSADFLSMIDDSNQQDPQSISFYLHIPFCPQICHFCGCNTTLYKDEGVVKRYVDRLMHEIELVTKHLDPRREVTQIHWGGGTPNSIPFHHIERVMNYFYKHFKVSENAEIAMECNPAYLELTDVIELANMGFNRISLGVQDFDLLLLKKINRLPSKYPVKDLVQTARKAGFRGVNLDLMYGLPEQTLENHLESVEKAIDINPDRIVTFSYAHVPWFKTNQKKLEGFSFPSAEEKITMLESSYNKLVQNGYQAIGMDHYVKKGDELYQALQQHKLQRNFQGYATQETTGQVYAFGATAISQLTSGYAQNERNIRKYMDALEHSNLPVLRGYILNSDETIIRKVINEIMCNHYLNWQSVAQEMGTTPGKVKETVGFSEGKLDTFLQDGMLEYNENEIQVTSKGFFLIRNIAMAFDPQRSDQDKQYSKTI